MSDHPLRVCDLCGAIDDHPRARHLFGEGEAPDVPRDLIVAVSRNDSVSAAVRDAALEELLDPASACRHMDCCAANGCAYCTAVLAGVGANSETGDALRTLLTAEA